MTYTANEPHCGGVYRDGVAIAFTRGDELEAPAEARRIAAALTNAESGPLSSFDYALIADALDILDPDGSEATNRKQELEAWARQMAETGRGHLPAGEPGHTAPAIRVLVAIEGGLVQGAVADRPGVSVITLDYDTDGADPDEVFAIPQDDGSTSNATRGGLSAEHDPAWIDRAEAAELAEPEEAIARLRRRAKSYDERYPENAAEARAQADAIEARLAVREEAGA